MPSSTVDLDQSRGFTNGIVDHHSTKEDAKGQVTSSLITFFSSFEISK